MHTPYLMHKKVNHRNCTKKTNSYLSWAVPLSLESGTNYCGRKMLLIFLLMNKSQFFYIYFKTFEQHPPPQGFIQALFFSSISMQAILLIVYIATYISNAMDFAHFWTMDTIDTLCVIPAAMVQLEEKSILPSWWQPVHPKPGNIDVFEKAESCILGQCNYYALSAHLTFS